MKEKIFIIAVFLTIFIACDDSKTNENIEESPFYETEIAITPDSVDIFGTLLMPDSVGKFPLVIIVAGSGPTDRDGNNRLGITAKPYFLIADTLVKRGIASFRYDKRAIGKSVVKNLQEKDLRFDTYVNDLVEIIKNFKDDTRFSEIIILGHSEGALIGAVTCNTIEVDKFISVAGTSRPADSILIEQLKQVPDIEKEEVLRIISIIKNGEIATTENATLNSIFRESVQPYMTSWFKFIPKNEYSKLTIPTLIIHGTTDIQVPTSDAEELNSQNSQTTLSIIEGMNHILKNAPADTLKNTETYKNSDLPLNEEFVADIIKFITE